MKIATSHRSDLLTLGPRRSWQRIVQRRLWIWGYTVQSLLEQLSEYGQSSATGSNRWPASKNRDAKVDFRDLLMILSGS